MHSIRSAQNGRSFRCQAIHKMSNRESPTARRDAPGFPRSEFPSPAQHAELVHYRAFGIFLEVCFSQTRFGQF